MSADVMTLRRRLAPFGAALTLILASCGGSECTGPLCVETNVSVSVSPTTGTIHIGETLQLSATVTGATNTSVTWSVSTGTSVVSVNSSGLVTGIGAGNAVVVATSVEDGSRSASASITVVEPVLVSISPAVDTIQIGESTTLTATVTGATNTAVTWSVTSGAAAADVTSGGVVTGLATGTAVIQATAVADVGATATATVEVMCDGGVIGLDQTVTGQLSITDCDFAGNFEDYWYLTLNQATDVVIDLGSNEFDTWVYLYEFNGASGSLVASNDDTNGYHSQIAMTLAAGSYEIIVSSFDPGEVGEYDLTVTEGVAKDVDVVIENELLNETLIYLNGFVVGTVPAQDTAQDVFSVVDLQVSWDLVPDTTANGTEIGDLDIHGNFSEILSPDLFATETFSIDAVIGGQGIFKPTIINNTGVTLLMGVNVGLAGRENLCYCTVPIGSAGTWIGYYYLETNSNLYAYASGSNYTGTPSYFDGFAGSVDPITGHLSFTFTTAPSPTAPAGAAGAVSPRTATGAAEVGAGPRAFVVQSDYEGAFEPYQGPAAPRSRVHHDERRDPGERLLRAAPRSKPDGADDGRIRRRR